MATAHEDLGYALYVHEYSTGNFDEARYYTFTIVVSLFSSAFNSARHHVIRWLTAVPMDYNSPTSNSLQLCSNMFSFLCLLFAEALCLSM